MNDWKARLQPASFRGVAFKVDTDSSPVGRDAQVHEYPKRDQPYVEDMGRKTRLFRLTAFVVGPDCFEARDALLNALNEPGPGELAHPWYGRMNVTATGDCSVSHDRREGGIVRFELAFIEAGKLEWPTAQPNTAQQLKGSAQTVAQSASSRFAAALEHVDASRIKAHAMSASASSVYAAMHHNVRPLRDLFTSSTGVLETLLNAPEDIATLIMSSLFDQPREFLNFRTAQTNLRGNAAAVASLAAAPAPVSDNAARLHTATVGLLQDAAIVDAMLEAAHIPVGRLPATQVEPTEHASLDVQLAHRLEAPEIPVADDVIDIRHRLTQQIWQVAMDAPPAHYTALTDARQQLHAHLTNVARSGTRLVSVTPATTAPALVLAYQRYADASRATEIAQRNGITHPGFVPALPLQMAQV